MTDFRSLGLSDESISAITKKGFEEPTKIQALTIPLLLEDKADIIAQAQTGTGKTAAFALPILEKINPANREIQAIILAPTRELVIQICEEIDSLRMNNNISIASIYGGQSIDIQFKKLKRGVSIVVGTPGRIMDHMERGTLKLGGVKYFVLDEADEMLNMGFVDDIETILAGTGKQKKRILLFSATMPDRIKKLAERYMGDYEHLKTKTEMTVNLTDQIYFEVAHRDKFEATCRIIDIENDFYGLVFCRTKNDVDDLVMHLLERGYQSEALHGDVSQAQREKTLTKFRKRHISILIATDVAARGIDVNNLTHVINYSIPHDPEAYVHRIGRTGRAGNQGTAITFVTPAEFRKLGFIKKVTKADIRREQIPEVSEIIKVKKNNIEKAIKKIAESDLKDEFTAWGDKLLKDVPPNVLVSSMLQYAFGKYLQENNYREIGKRKAKLNDSKLMGERGSTRLFIAKGKNSGTSKKSLVDFIMKNAKISHHMIEDVAVLNEYSFITVPYSEAEKILKKFRKERVGRQALVERAKKI
jgi:ATP-dependent RNA helicase DeaD